MKSTCSVWNEELWFHQLNCLPSQLLNFIPVVPDYFTFSEDLSLTCPFTFWNDQCHLVFLRIPQVSPWPDLGCSKFREHWYINHNNYHRCIQQGHEELICMFTDSRSNSNTAILSLIPAVMSSSTYRNGRTVRINKTGKNGSIKKQRMSSITMKVKRTLSSNKLCYMSSATKLKNKRMVLHILSITSYSKLYLHIYYLILQLRCDFIYFIAPLESWSMRKLLQPVQRKNWRLSIRSLATEQNTEALSSFQMTDDKHHVKDQHLDA